MRSGRQIYYSILVMVVLASSWYSAKAQTPPAKHQHEEYQRLYNRSLTYDKTDHKQASAWANHIWMAYLADSTQAAVLKDMAIIHGVKDHPQEMIRLLSSAFKHSNYDRYIGLNLMDAAQKSNQLTLAEETCLRLLKQKPDSPELLTQLVDIYLNEQNGEKAIHTLDKLIATDSNTPIFLFKKAQILDAMGQSKEAEEILKGYLLDKPNDVGALTSLLTIYGKQGRYADAENLIKKLHEITPNSSFIYEIWAEFKLQKGDYRGAANEVLKVSHIDGTTPETIEKMIATLIDNSKDYTAMLRALIPIHKEMMETYPESPSFGINLAKTYLIEKDTTQAEGVLLQLVDQKVNDPYPYIYFTEKYARTENTQALYDFTTKSIEIFPDNGVLNLYAAFATIQLDKGKDKAMAIIDNAIKNIQEGDSAFPDILLLKADILQQEGKMNEAIPFYDKAISLNSNHALAYNNYAYSLATYGKNPDLKKAEEMASMAIKLDPGNPSFLDTYAWILYLKGEYTVAKVYMESAISHMSSDEDQKTYYEHYAKILEQTGDTDAAIKAWQASITYGGDAKEITKHIEKLQKK